MHPRKLIRSHVHGLLLDATAAGSNVFKTRVIPITRPELPAIAVYTLSEDSDYEGTAPRELKAELELVVQGHVEASADVDDAMDDLAEEIETALHADPFFGGLVFDSVLSGTLMEVVDDGEREVGVVELTYTVTYWREAPATPEPADDFNTAHTTYNLGNQVDPGDDAEDSITVQVP